MAGGTVVPSVLFNFWAVASVARSLCQLFEASAKFTPRGTEIGLNLNAATQEVIALSSSDLQRNRVTLKSELADVLPPVNGDRVQLQQVILNLVRNASDAMGW